MIEVEIKLKINNKAEIEDALIEHGFKKATTSKEIDQYFNGARRDLRDTDEALRIRKTTRDDGTCIIADGSPDDELITLTYKGPKLDDVSMSRKEVQVNVSDYDGMVETLTALGYKPVMTVSKTRVEYYSEEMCACLDEVEGLGSFIELEIIVDSEADRQGALDKIENELVALGYSMADTTTTSYLSMLEQRMNSDDEQIIRIKEMEIAYDKVSCAVNALDDATEQYVKVLPYLQKLLSYYVSELWQDDFADDEAGKFPADLKRGVLSEDGVYDLLMKHKALFEKIEKLKSKKDEE